MARDNAYEERAGVLRFAQIEIDEGAYELRCFGRRVSVEPKVYALIASLLRNRRRVVSKAELIESVWLGTIVSDSAITRCVSLARRALGGSARIANVHGRGYRLVDDDQNESGEPRLCAECRELVAERKLS